MESKQKPANLQPNMKQETPAEAPQARTEQRRATPIPGTETRRRSLRAAELRRKNLARRMNRQAA